MSLLAQHTILDEGDTSTTIVLMKGDRVGFRELFESYYTPLCAYAAGFVGAGDSAEEVTQSVFVQLWYRAEQGDVRGNIKAYLYRSVRNRAINLNRHDKVLQRVQGIVANTLMVGDVIPGVAGAPIPPDAKYEVLDTATQIQRLVRSLPTRMREVLTLRWDHDMSYREIATVLGIREKSARQQHSRAIAALRQQAVGFERWGGK